jgi:hypothetical protein
MRRYYRAVKLHNERAAAQHGNKGVDWLFMLRGQSSKDHRQDMSSCRLARDVRRSKRQMRIDDGI